MAATVASSLLLAACGSAGTSGARSGTTASTATSPPAASSAGGSSLKVSGTPRFASPSPSQPIRTGTVQVAYRNITIDPDTLRVKVGTTVRWTNFDPVEHNVTSVSGPQAFATSNFGEGTTVSIKLTHPGTIHYESTNHPVTMNGTIEVLR